MKLTKLQCECCGGTINSATGVCEYCGMRYKIEEEQLVRVETYHNPIRTYKALQEIPQEFMQIDPEKASQHTVKMLARNLADAIAECMDLSTEYDPRRCVQRVTARIRIVEPKYHF